MATKLGTLNHAKGFVINKLLKQKRVGGSHVPVDFLKQGYLPKYRYLISAAIEDLKNEGAIRVERKRTGRGYDDHATLVMARLPKLRGLLNAYRKSERLQRLGRDLKTWLPG